jgi:hypothetical protein
MFVSSSKDSLLASHIVVLCITVGDFRPEDKSSRIDLEASLRYMQAQLSKHSTCKTILQKGIVYEFMRVHAVNVWNDPKFNAS